MSHHLEREGGCAVEAIKKALGTSFRLLLRGGRIPVAEIFKSASRSWWSIQPVTMKGVQMVTKAKQGWDYLQKTA